MAVLLKVKAKARPLTTGLSKPAARLAAAPVAHIKPVEEEAETPAPEQLQSAVHPQPEKPAGLRPLGAPRPAPAEPAHPARSLLQARQPSQPFGQLKSKTAESPFARAALAPRVPLNPLAPKAHPVPHVPPRPMMRAPEKQPLLKPLPGKAGPKSEITFS